MLSSRQIRLPSGDNADLAVRTHCLDLGFDVGLRHLGIILQNIHYAKRSRGTRLATIFCFVEFFARELGDNVPTS